MNWLISIGAHGSFKGVGLQVGRELGQHYSVKFGIAEHFGYRKRSTFSGTLTSIDFIITPWLTNWPEFYCGIGGYIGLKKIPRITTDKYLNDVNVSDVVYGPKVILGAVVYYHKRLKFLVEAVTFGYYRKSASYWEDDSGPETVIRKTYSRNVSVLQMFRFGILIEI